MRFFLALHVPTAKLPRMLDLEVLYAAPPLTGSRRPGD